MSHSCGQKCHTTKSLEPSVENFRVWGSLAHVHVSYEKRGKLDEEITTCILLGFLQESKGYKPYNPKTQKVIVSRDVVFEETKGWNWEEDQHHTDSELTWNDDDMTWEESKDENDDEVDSDDEAEQPVEVTEEAQVEQPVEVREG